MALTDPSSPPRYATPGPTITSEPWHAIEPDLVLHRLDSRDIGLTTEEATARLAQYGPNVLDVAPPKTWWSILAGQFVSPLIAILFVAGVITSVQQHWVDAGAIFIVLVINAALGFWQERKAERDVRALQSMSTTQSHVLRDQAVVVLDSDAVVPGDIVQLASGDQVPADLRLIDATALQIDESMLTGESLAASKATDAVDHDAPVGDRRGMAYSGTFVTSGRGVGVVVATATHTELGEINELVQSDAPTTPLQMLTHSLERRIGIAVLLAVAFVFVVGLFSGYTLTDMFRVAVALAVATIPESLPIILTVAMSVGVSRMAARGAIVRTLPSVETLGSTTVIASDKTGTLTQNSLTVERLWSSSGTIDLTTDGHAHLEDAVLTTAPTTLWRDVLRAGALTNEAEPTISGDLAGDAVDVAMARIALDAGAVDEAQRAAEPVAYTPYEPTHAYSQTLRREQDRLVLYVKGSPDAVGSRSTRMATAQGDRPFDAAQLAAANEEMARDGLRVIATARREFTEAEIAVILADTDGSLPDPVDLTLLGLHGMTDPPREGVAEAIAACHQAGISVKMVTGDHPVTAQAIGHRLGLNTSGEPVTGAEMATLDDEALARRLDESEVAARVAPRDKLRIVNVLQANNEVVAVTGDGVNDAPALRAASIGVSMGKDGTDVAREASDLVLTDDNFVTIVDAVEQGRVTFAAIRKATFFLLSTAVAGVISLAINVVLEQPLLFLPVQILWINLVTTGIQDIALALEPAEGDELQRQPRSRTEGVLSRVLWVRTAISGVWMGLVVLGVFTWALQQDHALDHARTLAMTVFVLFNFFQVNNARAEARSSFTISPLRNKLLMWTAIGGVALLWAVTAWAPSANLLGLSPLSLTEWAVLTVIAGSVAVLVEIDKLVRRRLTNRRTVT